MQRQCGDCQLCCKLLPVADAVLTKAAGSRCHHQAHHVGCRVYGGAAMPSSCRLWNCAWLVDDDAAGLRRPDRSHYVIDVSPDFVTLQPNDGGPASQMPVLQIWIDPNHPDAHRDPALRDMLDRQHVAALVRSNSSDAFLLVPPSVAADSQWHEQAGGSTGRQHTMAEIADVFGPKRDPSC
jgi:hypothetical protein